MFETIKYGNGALYLRRDPYLSCCFCSSQEFRRLPGKAFSIWHKTNGIWSARKKSEILMAVNGPTKYQKEAEREGDLQLACCNDKLLSDPIERRAHAQRSV